MTQPALVDVDVALKLCTYRAESDLVACASLDQPPAMLAIGRFTLRSRIRNALNIVDKESVQNSVENLISNITLLNPTQEEINFAADIEEAAARNAVELDTGESQLVAILVQRSSPLLLTGDKRAIRAIHDLAILDINGRIACLEQVVACVLEKGDHKILRNNVCREPRADTAITICFACSAPHVSKRDIMEGLTSYIENLRQSTGPLLLESVDLSAAIS